MVGGDEHSGLTGLGDGWAVGVVSAAVTLPAIVSLALRRWQPIAGLAFAVAGLAILAIAGYDVNHDWNARYTGWNANATDVDVMPALWATIALGLALCLGGLALRALRKRETSANQLPLGIPVPVRSSRPSFAAVSRKERPPSSETCSAKPST